MQKQHWFKTFWLLSFFITPWAHGEPLHIETSQGRVTFEIEHAKDLREGLMWRTELAEKTGMLFVYRRPGIANMWMKNTLIPLDMIFIKQDGTVESVHANAQPKSLKRIGSVGPVKAVLEINGSEAAKFNIQSGDRVIHPVFTTQEHRPKRGCK